VKKKIKVKEGVRFSREQGARSKGRRKGVSLRKGMSREPLKEIVPG